MSVLSILREFAAEYNVIAIRTEDFRQRSYIEVFGCFDERIGSLLWSIEESNSCGKNSRSSRNCFGGGRLRCKHGGRRPIRPRERTQNVNTSEAIDVHRF